MTSVRLKFSILWGTRAESEIQQTVLQYSITNLHLPSEQLTKSKIKPDRKNNQIQFVHEILNLQNPILT